jgi:TPR repeat protein
LPFAEQDMAMYRVELALAYALGVGVPEDVDAALVLLDAADKRWPGNAYAAFAEQWGQMSKAQAPAKVMARLEVDAGKGSLRAAAIHMHLLSRDRKDSKLEPRELAVATALADAGNRAGREFLYLHYKAVGDETATLRALERGVAAGDSSAKERLGRRLFQGKDLVAQASRAESLMRTAAHAGSTEAMLWMGGISRAREQWKEAEAWFQSAVLFEEDDALDGLLELYSKPRPGLAKGPKEAMQLFVVLEPKLDKPEFRRSFAAFLQQAPEPRDLERARKLLEVDAQKGDEQSQYLLGIGLLRGKFGKADPTAGMAWIEKAMASGPDAKDAYAHHLYYRDRSAEARARALAIERKLVGDKHDGAMNNLAWWLCTSADAALRNPTEGLAVAQGMGDVEALSYSVLDTLAACEAATGQFEPAARHQQRVVDYFRLVPSRTTPLARFEARLSAYRKHESYVETREDEPVE